MNNNIHTNLNLKNVPRVIYKYLLFKQHNINIKLYQHFWLSTYYLKTASLHKKVSQTYFSLLKFNILSFLRVKFGLHIIHVLQRFCM